MAKIIDNTNNLVHIDNKNFGILARFTELDDAVLVVKLLKDGQPYIVTGQTLSLRALRLGDNQPVLQEEGVISNKDEVTINFRNNVLAKNGKVSLQINFKDSTGQFSSQEFFIDVAKDNLGEDAIAGSDNIQALEKVKNEFVDSSNKLKSEFVTTSEKLKNDFKTTGDKQVADQRADYESLKDAITSENPTALLQDQINKNTARSTNNETRIDEIENHVPVWQEQVGQNGNLTINDGFEGTVKDLIIKGKTVGGYNSETGQSDNIVSSGEVEGNKIIIKSIGKNLLDVNKKENQTIGTLIYTDGTIYDSPNRDYYYTSWIKCEKATKYTVSGLNSKVRIVSYDSNKNFKSGGEYGTVSVVKGDYIRVGYIIAYMNNVMLEESTLATEYEPYQEDKIEVLLPNEVVGGHKGLLNTQNEYYGNTGKYIEKVKSYDILPDWNWMRAHGTQDNITTFSCTNHAIQTPVGDYKGICNNFINRYCWSNGKVGIWRDTNRGMYVSISKSLLATDDATGFKKYLTDNPTVFYGELETPITHNIEKMSLPQYNGTTHIIVENEIAGDISCKAKVSLSAQNNRLKEENTSLKKEIGEEQEIQDSKITTTMLANTELFEIIIGVMPMQTFKGGEMKMVEVYVTLIIQGDKTLDQVPAIIRPQVEAKLRLLGVIA